MPDLGPSWGVIPLMPVGGIKVTGLANVGRDARPTTPAPPADTAPHADTARR
jgi:hypothetical protein